MNNATEIPQTIDHTLLRPDAVATDVERLCREALACRFATVVVHPIYLEPAVKLLSKTSVGVGTVVDFCFGASPANIKVFEAEEAIRNGASELDMVINIGLLKSGAFREVEAEVMNVVRSSKTAWSEIHEGGAPVIKVIIEAGLLTDEEKVSACQIIVAAGADYVKTSTGYFGTGATAADVALMRKTVGPGFGVKASGGIRTLSQAEEMLRAGADRIGTSSGLAIFKEWRERSKAGSTS